MTMLLFDAGNSRCKWAWLDGETWLQQGVIDNADADAWLKLKKQFSVLISPRKIFVSNVAGKIIALKLQDLCSVWDCPVHIIAAHAQECGVLNLYKQPEQLGSDRWAALIFAWNQSHTACLVVNCGTATTVDTLSARGEFIGGIILPGIDLMQRSLLAGTANLEFDKGEFCDFPRNTADAIVSGVLLATIGAIQHQYSLLDAGNNARCIIGGGAARALCAHLKLPFELMDNLVLQGMKVIGREDSAMNKKEMVT